MPAICSKANSAATPAMWESPAPVMTIRFTDRHSLWFMSRRTRMSSVSNSERISSGKLFTWATIFFASCSTLAPLPLAIGYWPLTISYWLYLSRLATVLAVWSSGQ
jgi:hypothetical protein